MARKISGAKSGCINSMLVPEPSRRSPRAEVAASLYFCASLFVALSLMSYDQRDPSFNAVTTRPQVSNLCGLVGSHIADAVIQVVGYASLLIPVWFMVLGVRALIPRKSPLRWTDFLSAAIIVSAASSLLNRLQVGPIVNIALQHPGGALGILLHSSTCSS